MNPHLELYVHISKGYMVSISIREYIPASTTRLMTEGFTPCSRAAFMMSKMRRVASLRSLDDIYVKVKQLALLISTAATCEPTRSVIEWRWTYGKQALLKFVEFAQLLFRIWIL